MADMRIWNEDWEVGDKAECVVEFDDWSSTVPPWERPKKGDILTVIGFQEAQCARGHTRYFLNFQELARGLTTNSFRKVRPISEAEQTGVGGKILKGKGGRIGCARLMLNEQLPRRQIRARRGCDELFEAG